MKKIMLLILILILSGCNNKKVDCIYKNETNDTVNSYIRVILISDDAVIKEEKLNAVYQFNDSASADKYYEQLESTIEQDKSLTIKQVDERIMVTGEKDVSELSFTLESKVTYYEQLGYTCK